MAEEKKKKKVVKPGPKNSDLHLCNMLARGMTMKAALKALEKPKK